jgi:hypothetical protein
MKFSLLLFLLLATTFAQAQPTPHEYRYIWAWNGAAIWEKPTLQSKQIAHLPYGDSVFFEVTLVHPQETCIINACKGETVRGVGVPVVSFPAWNVESGWLAVRHHSMVAGFIPEFYCSKMKPFVFDTTNKRAKEGIDEYFARNNGVLESSVVHSRTYPFGDFTRIVFGKGVIYELRYFTYQLDRQVLVIPDITLAEAFHFLNALYVLEPTKRGGKPLIDNVRLVQCDENRLVFTNKYAGGESRKQRTTQFTIQKFVRLVLISIEESVAEE